ncbi:transcription factor HHO3-like isoform X2 [Telopea speciosissima]|uniref:transcription factor HHO3-like isoform X2 n=1 Tax=Telopea speciosissima TaxID=54955 RepID=UPI001CC755DE|nr:transcription factor HHO3-like isoform X2 [Telopea speciosissima]
MEDYLERMQRCREYVEALEEERRKIQVFHRELPLCLELVTQAIDACRQQVGSAATTAEYFPGRSECSEQTSSEGPMLEEFIPIKRNSSSTEEESQNKSKCEEINDKDKPLQKTDWLRSVQLWNTDSDPSPPKQDQTEKPSLIEPKKSVGAFHAFQRDNKGATISSTTTTTDTVANGDDSSKKEDKEEKEGLSQRKPRRCWSPELHRRFLHALQQLGGSHAATPKQIRELMKVDGLTNDEVKSHLQKYRLHTRRPRSAAIPNGSNPQQPQFVVVGGIWVPPPEYDAVAAATTRETNGVATNGIYSPVAAAPMPPLPSTVKQSQRSTSPSEERRRRNQSADEKSHSNSPDSSSSTHTTTASPAC